MQQKGHRAFRGSHQCEVGSGKSAGVVAIESKVITELPAVTEMLAPRSKVDPNYRVVIRADRKTPAQYVEKVMAACAEAGITQTSPSRS